ncbi:reverse transcriptase domain-containing protein [Tanacetum coccineum]
MPQEEQVLTPRSWRLYMGRETGKEGSKVGMILDSPEGKVYSYVIRLNFHASEDIMDYEALLARLFASVERGMKDLHVFAESKMLVDQAEGNRTPRTEEKKVQGRDHGCHDTISQRIDQPYYSPKGEAIRLREGDMTQDPLDGQLRIYSQFFLSSEQQAMFSGIPCTPPLWKMDLKRRSNKEGNSYENLNPRGAAVASSPTLKEGRVPSSLPLIERTTTTSLGPDETRSDPSKADPVSPSTV